MLKGFTADMLGVIHARSDITVPALIEALDDKEPQVRFESLRALGKFGPAAVAAVPALQQATNDPELGIREVATFSLKQIQLPAP
jgi:HEAT repeat protein